MTDEQLLEAAEELLLKNLKDFWKEGNIRYQEYKESEERTVLRRLIIKLQYKINHGPRSKTQQAIHHAEKLIELLKS